MHESYVMYEQFLQSMVFYRVAIKLLNGNMVWSNIVTVRGENHQPGMSISPNPIVDNTIHLQLNNIKPGNHKAFIYNVTGQLMETFNFITDDRMNSKTLKINNKLPKGCYTFCMEGEKWTFMTE